IVAAWPTAKVVRVSEPPAARTVSRPILDRAPDMRSREAAGKPVTTCTMAWDVAKMPFRQNSVRIIRIAAYGGSPSMLRRLTAASAGTQNNVLTAVMLTNERA